MDKVPVEGTWRRYLEEVLLTLIKKIIVYRMYLLKLQDKVLAGSTRRRYLVNLFGEGASRRYSEKVPPFNIFCKLFKGDTSYTNWVNAFPASSKTI